MSISTPKSRTQEPLFAFCDYKNHRNIKDLLDLKFLRRSVIKIATGNIYYQGLDEGTYDLGRKDNYIPLLQCRQIYLSIIKGVDILCLKDQQNN
jgi:hypothetical protein